MQNSTLPDPAAPSDASQQVGTPPPLDLADGMRLQVEPYPLVLPQLKALHVAHYNETELGWKGVPPRLDYEYYVELARAGGYLTYTLRVHGWLIGYINYFLSDDLHTGQFVASDDGMFIAKPYRGGFTALRMLRYALDDLKRRGVKRVDMGSQKGTRAGALYRRAGLKPVATLYVTDL